MSNPITYYSMARFVVVRDAATVDLLHACSMEAERRFDDFGDVFSHVAERLERPWATHPRDDVRAKALAYLEGAASSPRGGRVVVRAAEPLTVPSPSAIRPLISRRLRSIAAGNPRGRWPAPLRLSPAMIPDRDH